MGVPLTPIDEGEYRRKLFPPWISLIFAWIHISGELPAQNLLDRRSQSPLINGRCLALYGIGQLKSAHSKQ